ncbi:MAG: hypothetical protein E7635_06945 [Ruminococcaceae bacterium]|nr:hypothetical protein [Oscillospiraceae bacterium]
MTAVNNINYCRTFVYHNNRNNPIISIAAKAIGADDNTTFALFRRLRDLKKTKVPTVVEISGIEYAYSQNKAFVDRLFAFLSYFSRKHKLVKFAVMVGSMRYIL